MLLFKQGPALGWRLFLVVTFSVILMFYDHRSADSGKIRLAITTAVAPIQYTVATPIEMLAWLKDSFNSHQALVTENTDLKAELLLQNAKVQKVLALEKENQQLRILLQSSSYVGGKIKVAQVLAINIDPFLAQIVLDRGQNAQVYEGQPVFDAYGVMGQVIAVNPLTSRVMLLTDTRSAVPVQDTRTGVRAIVVGTGAGQPLVMINVPETADIKVGDRLSTSGLDLRYPVGYPVGIIKDIKYVSGQHFAKVIVEPAARIDKSRQVLLVWQKKPKVFTEAKEELDKMAKEKSQDQALRNTLSNANL